MSNVVKLHPKSVHKWDPIDRVCFECGIGRNPETEAEPCAAGDFSAWARHVARQRNEK